MGTFIEDMRDALLGSRTVDLEVISWRRSLHAVRRENRSYPDDYRIELKCRWRQSLLEGDILVGEDGAESESLDGVTFSMELCAAHMDSKFGEKKPESSEGQNAVGMLVYSPAISPDDLAGLPPSVAEESKSASVNGWIFYGDRSLREISRLLDLQPRLSFRLLVTIRAASAGKPSCLLYETKPYRPTTYRWHSKNDPLEITEARVLVENS